MQRTSKRKLPYPHLLKLGLFASNTAGSTMWGFTPCQSKVWLRCILRSENPGLITGLIFDYLCALGKTIYHIFPCIR